MALTPRLRQVLPSVGDATYATNVAQMLSNEGVTTLAAAQNLTDADWQQLRSDYPWLKRFTRNVFQSAPSQPAQVQQQQHSAVGVSGTAHNTVAVAGNGAAGTVATTVTSATTATVTQSQSCDDDRRTVTTVVDQSYTDSTTVDQSSVAFCLNVTAGGGVGFGFATNDFSASRSVDATFHSETRVTTRSTASLERLGLLCAQGDRAGVMTALDAAPNGPALPTAQNLGSHLTGSTVPQPAAFISAPAAQASGGQKTVQGGGTGSAATGGTSGSGTSGSGASGSGTSSATPPTASTSAKAPSGNTTTATPPAPSAASSGGGGGGSNGGYPPPLLMMTRMTLCEAVSLISCGE